MNINKTLILVGILFSSILVIGNMTQPLPAYIFWFSSHGWTLSVVSILTGIMIGYGIKGLTLGNKDEDEDDNFDF